MPKWCYAWPHCACGLEMANDLAESGMKLLVFRDGTGDLKRVPVSEIQTIAIVEGEEQFVQSSLGRCPRKEAEDAEA